MSDETAPEGVQSAETLPGEDQKEPEAVPHVICIRGKTGFKFLGPDGGFESRAAAERYIAVKRQREDSRWHNEDFEIITTEEAFAAQQRERANALLGR